MSNSNLVAGVMARRWKPTAASDDDIASDINKAGQQNSDVNFGVEKADYMDADASRPSFASPQRHEVGIRETTAREAKYLETLFEEWVQGDPNHTAALILLGVTLLAVALWHWIGWLFAPTWEKFCGIAALSCLISALYPWVSPLQNRLHAHRTTLKGRIEVGFPLCLWMLFTPSKHINGCFRSF